MTVAEMERSGLVAVLGLATGSGMIELEAALEGRVTEECMSMYNVAKNKYLVSSYCKTPLLAQ